MVVRKEDLHHLVDQLPEQVRATAFDFLQHLLDRSDHRLTWDEIDQLEPDEEPLSEDARRQLSSDSGYVSGEDVKREFGLQVDIP